MPELSRLNTSKSSERWRGAEGEPLLDAGVERADRGQPELIHLAHQQHGLAPERIGRHHVALEERLGVALARHQVGAEVQAPRAFVRAVGDELIARRHQVDVALAAARRLAHDQAAVDLRSRELARLRDRGRRCLGRVDDRQRRIVEVLAPIVGREAEPRHPVVRHPLDGAELEPEIALVIAGTIGLGLTAACRHRTLR